MRMMRGATYCVRSAGSKKHEQLARESLTVPCFGPHRPSIWSSRGREVESVCREALNGRSDAIATLWDEVRRVGAAVLG